MEEEEKYEIGGEESAPIAPSMLQIVFAGPGSAQIIEMKGGGIVTPEQMGAAGLWLLSRCLQEWSIPLLQEVVKHTVAATLEELQKPRIEEALANFAIPPDMLRGKPS